MWFSLVQFSAAEFSRSRSRSSRRPPALSLPPSRTVRKTREANGNFKGLLNYDLYWKSKANQMYLLRQPPDVLCFLVISSCVCAVLTSWSGEGGTLQVGVTLYTCRPQNTTNKTQENWPSNCVYDNFWPLFSTPIDPFEPIWTHLVPFGKVWTNLDSFGPILTYLDPFEQIWCQFEHKD